VQHLSGRSAVLWPGSMDRRLMDLHNCTQSKAPQQYHTTPKILRFRYNSHTIRQGSTSTIVNTKGMYQRSTTMFFCPRSSRPAYTKT
jgi:hypothetical protein